MLVYLQVFSDCSDTPVATYFLDCTSASGGTLTGDPITIKKMKKEYDLTATIEVQVLLHAHCSFHHFKLFLYIYFTTITKQVIRFILMLVGTDCAFRWSSFERKPEYTGKHTCLTCNSGFLTRVPAVRGVGFNFGPVFILSYTICSSQIP